MSSLYQLPEGSRSFEPVKAAMAASLSCFWIYQQLGEELLSEGIPENNPYQHRICLYSGELFGEAVFRNIGICDKAAENTTPAIRERMSQAYLYSAHFEYEFWEAGYMEGRWKIPL